MNTPTEIGSATVQVWVRNDARRRSFEKAMAEIDEAMIQNDIAYYTRNHPKPWFRDAIRKWWKGTEEGGKDGTLE